MDLSQQDSAEGDDSGMLGESSEMSESTEFSDYATDFAAQLRKQQKKVLEKEANKTFADSLKKHRDHLVDAWVETSNSNNSNGGEQQQQQQQQEQEDKDEDDVVVNGHNYESTIKEIEKDDFGDFEDANEDLDEQFFDTSLLSTGDVIGETTGETSSKEISRSISNDTGGVDNVDTPIQDVETKNGNNSSPQEDGLDAVTNQQDESNNNNIQGTENNTSNEDTLNVTQPLHVQDGDDFFGDFEAVETKEESKNAVDETDETETFGDFDDALPQEAETERSTETTVDTKNDDGAFGVLDANSESLQAPTHQQEEETSTLQTVEDTDVSAEDSFIDGNDNSSQFVGATALNIQEHDESTGVKEMNGDLIDDERLEVSRTDDSLLDDTGELGALDKVEKDKNTNENIDVNDNESGDLDTSPSDSQEPAAVPVGEEETDFGAFDAALSTSVESVDGNDDDDFGDFGAAPSDSREPKVEPEGGDTDFGAFDGALSTSVESVDGNDDDDDDDDFGDFDAAPSDSQESKVDPEGADTDFGAFDAAPSPSIEEDKKIDDANNDDDFGDFDSGPAQPQTALGAENDFGDVEIPPLAAEAPTNHESNEEDDDFGDFGDFDTAPAPKSSANAQTDNTDNDDFGDFDAALSIDEPSSDNKIETQNSEDDDDFGDFGDFDEAPSVPEPQKDDDNDDDDDDFGDFDDAAATPQQQAQDDGAFGQFDKAATEELDDFGRFEEGPSTSITPLAPVCEIGDTTRNFFVKMQVKYSFPEAEVVDEESVIKETPLEEIITSSSTTASVSKEVNEYELLNKVLKEIQKREGSSNLIIEGDGRGPSNAFVYPVGGLRAPDREYKIERDRRSSIMSTAKVPDVLPIQLPTGKENPLDAASPVTSRGRVSRTSATDVPSLPSLGTETTSSSTGTGTGSDSDGKVEKLLSKIPDLSFMLQSTLVLPKK